MIYDRPLTKVAVWFDEPAPGIKTIVRILQGSGSGQTVLFEQLVDVEPSGKAAIEIPPHVSVVGSGIIIQAANPQDSPGPIYLQGNRVDGYRDGRASINGDPGSRANDLVLQLWRRSTPRSVLMSTLRTPAGNLLFLAATAAALANRRRLGFPVGGAAGRRSAPGGCDSGVVDCRLVYVGVVWRIQRARTLDVVIAFDSLAVALQCDVTLGNSGLGRIAVGFPGSEPERLPTDVDGVNRKTGHHSPGDLAGRGVEYRVACDRQRQKGAHRPPDS